MFRSAAMMQRAAAGARTKHVQHNRKDSDDEDGTFIFHLFGRRKTAELSDFRP